LTGLQPLTLHYRTFYNGVEGQATGLQTHSQHYCLLTHNTTVE